MTGRAAVPPTALADLDARPGLGGERPRRRALVLVRRPADHPARASGRRRPGPDRDGLRIAQLARHELAVAFLGARLREALEREREELTAVVDGTTDLIVQVDGERRVVRLNPAGERLLGVERGRRIGRTCGDVLGCAVAGGHGEGACPLAEVLASGEPIAYRETALRGADGERGPGRRWLLGGALGDGPARPSGRPGDPARHQRRPRPRGAARGFVATVSHELRTPLALIRGYAESLLHLELEPASSAPMSSASTR